MPSRAVLSASLRMARPGCQRSLRPAERTPDPRDESKSRVQVRIVPAPIGCPRSGSTMVRWSDWPDTRSGSIGLERHSCSLRPSVASATTVALYESDAAHASKQLPISGTLKPPLRDGGPSHSSTKPSVHVATSSALKSDRLGLADDAVLRPRNTCVRTSLGLALDYVQFIWVPKDHDRGLHSTRLHGIRRGRDGHFWAGAYFRCVGHIVQSRRMT